VKLVITCQERAPRPTNGHVEEPNTSASQPEDRGSRSSAPTKLEESLTDALAFNVFVDSVARVLDKVWGGGRVGRAG
jgi:hypothetical protein